MNQNRRIALVTGGNRGIGFGICEELAKHGYHVLLGSRQESGRRQVEELVEKGHSVEFILLDVLNENDITNAFKYVSSKFGRLDVLINNAAIFLDNKEEDHSLSWDKFAKTMECNVYAPFKLIEIFAPLMETNNYGRIVNVSSGLGQLYKATGTAPAYSISKTALNAVTTYFASKYKNKNILINSVCPGWVRTDMGGSNASRTIEEGVTGIIWAATLDNEGPTGGFFRDGTKIYW
ncbi:3-oxoacyl-[acyl-carrier-protein] reductase FabG [Candidatus Rubidus massiliensis]|nr:3-oxoacyl-[acyl-carrier-protein] reductase FabG [Candidatus Rubidus massiliensis]